MGRGWIAGALAFGVLAGWTDAAAEPLNPLTLHVLILDEVGVEADTMRQTLEKPGESSRLQRSRWRGGFAIKTHPRVLC